jgi:hypothetical protein
VPNFPGTGEYGLNNRMLLELNGEEYADKEISGLCPNSTYDLSLRVKGSLFLDSVAPISLNEEIDYMDESGKSSTYTKVSKSAAVATTNEITNRKRYLPPMGAIVVKTTPATSLTVTLNTNRVVTSPTQVVRGASPRRSASSVRGKGIMTITAINPASSRCTSRLLLGQGYHNALREGEDAVLTTVNINRYSATSAPATPFNIYAVEGKYGLSIDLRDSLVNVPVSFYIGDLPFEPVTHLWFTGVNAIDGELVLYDIITDTERDIN